MKYLLETEHLRVRAFEERDAAPLYAIHLDGEVEKWFPNERYADEAEALDAVRFFADCVNRQELPYVLAVELKETGELIGDTGINAADGKPEEVEIGYVISRECRGRGYATELVRAMSEFAAETFRIPVLYGRVVRGNDASARVLEKSGYVFAAEEFGAEDDPYGNGMLVYRRETGFTQS